MKRSVRIAIAAGILMAPAMVALAYKSQAATPSFEVASIKPFKDGAPGAPIMMGGGCRGTDSATQGPGGGAPTQMMTFSIGGSAGGPPPNAPRTVGVASTGLGRCNFSRVTLKMLINSAYRLTALGGSLDSLLIGGPNWVGTDAFDVETKAEDPEHTTQDQLRAMLQTLLADRFKLKFHREKKEVPGFDLVLAKGGVKMKEADASEKNAGGMSMSMGNPGSGGMATVNSPGATITNIISLLSGRLGRAINDKTGLTGKYNFSLKWSPGDNETTGFGGLILQPGGGSSASSAGDPGGSLFTALQEQAGLKLEASKVMIDALVIDSAERPQD